MTARRTLMLLSLAAGLALAVVSRPAPAAPPTLPLTPVDLAVRDALRYLRKAQSDTGAWNGMNRPNAGVTGLAVMAFLSAGHVPGEGEHGAAIERGVRWVISQQRDNGLIATDGNYEMYHHGICTLMMAEVCGQLSGELADEVRLRLAKAVAIILRGQRTYGSARGGWRYQVQGGDADISVTGWQLLALRAAKNLGCDVPGEAIERAVEYVQRSFDANRNTFCYMPQGQPTIACCGTSILGLELCGKGLHRTDISLRAGATILRRPPLMRDQHCFYALYYCSQATFQLGEGYWEGYRGMMHNVLLNNQDKGGGATHGAWIGQDGEGRMIGPNYTTAMGVLALTVEYRFLPIYQRGEEPGEKE